MRPLVAQCYFGLGRVHLGTEKLRDAREDLIRARDLFYDLDMPKWVARSQAALSEVAARV